MPFNLEVYADSETKRLPDSIAICSSIETGFVLFNKCQSLERMLIKNAKNVDKTDDISQILRNFGGNSFVFAKNSKSQAKTKKFLKSGYRGDNFVLVEKLIRKVVLERLQLLQSKAQEGKSSIKFNLTEEIAETIGFAILKTAFGECNISEDEKVRIYIDGVEKDVSFTIALRTVWR